MSERKAKPSPEKGAQQSSPPNSGEASRRAEDLLAIGSENSDERAREAFVSIEDREAADRSNLTDDSDALTRRITGDQRGGDDNVDSAADDALDEKAREEGVTAANDTSRSVWEGTPHNL